MGKCSNIVQENYADVYIYTCRQTKPALFQLISTEIEHFYAATADPHIEFVCQIFYVPTYFIFSEQHIMFYLFSFVNQNTFGHLNIKCIIFTVDSPQQAKQIGKTKRFLTISDRVF